MIHYFTPYALDKNLGKAYNRSADLVANNEDWIVLMDGDVMFLTPDYGHIISENIERHKDISLFTCLTNRVGCKRQCYGHEISSETDIMRHISLAQRLAKERRHEIVETDWVISGHLLAIQKRIWNKIGGAKDGLLGVDNYISKQVLDKGLKIGIMQGLYVFHKYRFETGTDNRDHLK